MIIGISGKIGSGKDTVGKIIQYLVAQSKVGWVLPFTIEEFLEGKDVYNVNYVKDYKESISEDSNWEIKKFAGKLKQVVSILTGIPVEDLEKQQVKDRVLEEEWTRKIYFEKDGIKMKPTTDHKVEERPLKIRELLQLCGTEAIRNSIHENAWVNALFADYKSYNKKETLASASGFKLETELIYPNWIITDLRFPNEYQSIKDKGGICIRVNRDYVLSGGPEDPKDLHYSEVALDNHTFDYEINNDGTIEDLIEKVKEILIKEGII